MGPPELVHVGQRFGSLVVLALQTARRRRYRQYACQCDCGGRVSVITSDLRAGRVTSCGCARIEGARQAGRARLLKRDPSERERMI